MVGRSTYNLLRSVIAAAKPTDKTFEQLVEVLSAHYSPKPTEVMQWFRFNSRKRQDSETIANYVAELRRLAEFCSYGDALDKMLRDRLVWGVRDNAECRNRGEEPSRDAPKESVHFVKKQHQQQNAHSSGPGNCTQCGRRGHHSVDCPYTNFVCRGSHRWGHLQQMCRSTSGNPNPIKTPRSEKKHKSSVKQVEESEESETEADGLRLSWRDPQATNQGTTPC